MPIWNHLWPEYASTLIDMNDILVRPGETTDSFQQFFGEGVKSNIDSTKKFGELFMVADQTEIKAKLSDRGKPGKWLGYAKSHPKGTCRILNPKNRVIISRDVMFAGKEKSSDKKTSGNKLNDLVNEGYKSEDSIDSCTDMPTFVRCSDGIMRDSS